MPFYGLPNPTTGRDSYVRVYTESRGPVEYLTRKALSDAPLLARRGWTASEWGGGSSAVRPASGQVWPRRRTH